MKKEIGEIIDGVPEPGPAAVVFWLPPANEHRLAQSLGLLACDRDEYRRLLEAATVEAEARGCRVKLCKARCWRVVRELSRQGFASEPDTRAAIFALLWSETNAESDTSL